MDLFAEKQIRIRERQTGASACYPVLRPNMMAEGSSPDPEERSWFMYSARCLLHTHDTRRAIDPLTLKRDPHPAIQWMHREAYKRYHIPIVITETSARRDIRGRAQWMDKTIDAVRALRVEGIPVTAYTWFPLFTMVDWTYRRGKGPLKDYLIHLGLYDSALDSKGVLRRRETPLVKHFHQQMAQPMSPISSLYSAR